MVGNCYFMVIVLFMSFCGLNANEHQQKNGEKRGTFGTRDTDLRKAVFQAIWIVVSATLSDLSVRHEKCLEFPGVRRSQDSGTIGAKNGYL